MAVDTASKRFSMIGFGRPFLKLMVSSGTVDQLTMIDLYNGIDLSAVQAVVRGSIRGESDIQSLAAVSSILAITADSNQASIEADSDIQKIYIASKYTVQ